MNRDSILVSRRADSVYTLGYLLDLFDKEFVASQVGPRKLYLFHIDLSYGKINQNVCKALMRGRHISHIKKNGLIYNKYKNISIKKSFLKDFDDIHVNDTPKSFMNAANIIKRNYTLHYKKRNIASTLIQKYARRFIVKNAILYSKWVLERSVNVSTDVITTLPLRYPCVIKQDWNNGSTIVYEYETLMKCMIIDERPLYSYEDEHGVEYTVYDKTVRRDDKGICLYKSPMTRTFFKYIDIKPIINTLWYKLAIMKYKKLQKR